MTRDLPWLVVRQRNSGRFAAPWSGFPFKDEEPPIGVNPKCPVPSVPHDESRRPVSVASVDEAGQPPRTLPDREGWTGSVQRLERKRHRNGRITETAKPRQRTDGPEQDDNLEGQISQDSGTEGNDSSGEWRPGRPFPSSVRRFVHPAVSAFLRSIVLPTPSKPARSGCVLATLVSVLAISPFRSSGFVRGSRTIVVTTPYNLLGRGACEMGSDPVRLTSVAHSVAPWLPIIGFVQHVGPTGLVRRTRVSEGRVAS